MRRNKRKLLINATAPEKLGRKNSILFTDFVLWVMNDCLNKGIYKIYYFTREGIFFKNIHEIICRNNPHQFSSLDCELLEVSRMSTFLPSLKKYDRDEWLRLWRQYPDQTLGDFFRSLHIPTEKVLPYLYTYGLKAKDPIFTSEEIWKLLENPSFLSIIKKYGTASRNLLLNYLLQKGISENVRKIAIVDIGWRGTIQDNLCYLLPNCEINGYYLGLVPFLNPQPKNSLKSGYVNLSTNRVLLLKSVTPLEFITTSASGSVVGYHRSENGLVEADVIHNISEDYEYERFIHDFQQGVIEQAKAVCKFSRSYNNSSPDLRKTSFQLLYRLMAWPDFSMATHFFHLIYNEEFGLGCDLNRNYKFPTGLFLRAPFGYQNLQKLRKFLNSTSWPQGYLKIHHLEWLLPIYNIILKSASRLNSIII